MDSGVRTPRVCGVCGVCGTSETGETIESMAWIVLVEYGADTASPSHLQDRLNRGRPSVTDASREGLGRYG
jgi:hypothetical protein